MHRTRGTTRYSTRPHHRGSATNALIITLAALVAAGVSVATLHPRFSSAGNAPSAGHQLNAADPVHQEIIDTIGQLVARSQTVLFEHTADGSPFREALIWLTDGENPGVPDPDEIALLSYSPVLQAISIYIWDPPAEEGLTQRTPAPPDTQNVDDVSTLDFCNRWRTNAGVSRRIIATHISDAQWGTPTSYRPSEMLWRITLTWASETADQSDAASVTVRRGRIGAR